MKLNYLELKKLKKFEVGGNTFNNGGNIYWFNDNILYKIVGEYFFCDEVERNIDLQIKAPIMHTPVIYDKLFFNEDFAGYSMEYLKNSFTFRRAISLHIDYDVCVHVINDIYEVIQYLHDRNILIGDIHMDNFMMDNRGRGYVVDLDYIVFPGDEYKFQDLYCIKLKSDQAVIAINNKKTDNIKAMICSLSLLLGVDLESKFIHYFEMDIEKIYHEYIEQLGIPELKDYFFRIMNGEDVEYFNIFLNHYYKSFLKSGKVLSKKRLF